MSAVAFLVKSVNLRCDGAVGASILIIVSRDGPPAEREGLPPPEFAAMLGEIAEQLKNYGAQLLKSVAPDGCRYQ